MSDLLLVIAMGVITYGSRVVFMANPGRPPTGAAGRFLNRFPLALFVSLATATLLVPDADIEPTLGWAAFAGASVGAIVVRRSLYGVVVIGLGAYWTARLLTG